MQKILILGASGDLAKEVVKKINKTNNKIYKLKKKILIFLIKTLKKNSFIF